jgi:hypothetical protein
MAVGVTAQGKPSFSMGAANLPPLFLGQGALFLGQGDAFVYAAGP